MNIKLSTLLMALVVSGLTITLYAALLSGMYSQGHWIADLVTLLLAEAALIGGYAGMIGYTKLSTQAIARWNIVRQAGIWFALLAIAHTICCIVIPINIETVYWVVFGIVVVVCTVRMYFVHTGAIIQEQTESRQQALHVKQQAIAQTLHMPTTQLIHAIQNSNAEQYLKASATDAVRAISTLVDGFALKKVERNTSLTEEINRWNARLMQMTDSLNGGDSTPILQKIVREAQTEADIINNLYLQ